MLRCYALIFDIVGSLWKSHSIQTRPQQDWPTIDINSKVTLLWQFKIRNKASITLQRQNFYAAYFKWKTVFWTCYKQSVLFINLIWSSDFKLISISISLMAVVVAFELNTIFTNTLVFTNKPVVDIQSSNNSDILKLYQLPV